MPSTTNANNSPLAQIGPRWAAGSYAGRRASSVLPRHCSTQRRYSAAIGHHASPTRDHHSHLHARRGGRGLRLFDDILSWFYSVNKLKSQLQGCAKYPQELPSSKRKTRISVQVVLEEFW
jgi:hypothetical protein